MKKNICILLAALLAFSLLAGCGKQGSGDPDGGSGIENLLLNTPDPALAAAPVPEQTISVFEPTSLCLFRGDEAFDLPAVLVSPQAYHTYADEDVLQYVDVSLPMTAGLAFVNTSLVHSGFDVQYYTEYLHFSLSVSVSDYGSGYACDEMNTSENTPIVLGGCRTTFTFDTYLQFRSTRKIGDDMYVEIRGLIGQRYDGNAEYAEVPWLEYNNAGIILERYCDAAVGYIANNVSADKGGTTTREEYYDESMLPGVPNNRPELYTDYDAIGLRDLVRIQLGGGVQVYDAMTADELGCGTVMVNIPVFREEPSRVILIARELSGEKKLDELRRISADYYEPVPGYSGVYQDYTNYYYVKGDRLIYFGEHGTSVMDFEDMMAYFELL